MPGEDFAAVVKEAVDGPRIELVGTVTKAAKEGLEAAYADASAMAGEIILDFSQVDYINSTGIAVIVGVLAMSRSAGRQLGAVGLSDHYREVFQITRLSDFMTIYEDASSGT